MRVWQMIDLILLTQSNLARRGLSQQHRVVRKQVCRNDLLVLR